MENFCFIASEFGYVDYDEEEDIYYLRDIHFTKFTKHTQKIKKTKEANKTTTVSETSNTINLIAEDKPQVFGNAVNPFSSNYTPQANSFFYQNPVAFPQTQNFYPMMNPMFSRDSFAHQMNPNLNLNPQNQGLSQENRILDAIKGLETKFEEKIFRIEKNQNTINNVMDG